MKIILVLTFASTAMAACGGPFSATGSDTVQPVAAAWSQGYLTTCPGANPITITAGGSSIGATAVCAGTADIGMMSRDWKVTEATTVGSDGAHTCVKGGNKVTQIDVALDGITITAKTGGPAANCIRALVSMVATSEYSILGSESTCMYLTHCCFRTTQGGLTIAQLNIIFSNVKSAPKWSDLGPQCKAYTSAIKITGPDSTSGTNSFFQGVVFKGKQTFRSIYNTTANADYAVILKTIQSDDNYIGYMGFGYFVKNKNALTSAPIRNAKKIYVLPSRGSIADGSYSPFTRTLYMNLSSNTEATTKSFIQFGLSAAGSPLVTAAGFVPLSPSTVTQMLARL
jgi:ABC-type phosphate transport system substrate-binding protein